MSCLSRSFPFAFAVVLAASSVLAGCKKGETSSSPAATESTPSSVTTVTNAQAPSTGAASDSPLASRIQGTWISEDGNVTLEITPKTLRRRHKNIPGDPAPAIPYDVSKEDKGGILLSVYIETPAGKKVPMDPQAFMLLDPDTLKGGNAKSKKFDTYKRQK